MDITKEYGMLSVKATHIENIFIKKKHNLSQRKHTKSPKNALREGIPLSLKGSLSLEASLVMPLFMFFLMTILMGIEIVRLQSNVIEALHQGEGMAFAIKSSSISPSVCNEYISTKDNPYVCIDDKESGLKFSDKSSIESNGLIKLYADYSVKPFISVIPLKKMHIEDKVVGHAFTGFVPIDGGIINIDLGEYVYITRSGIKYHLSESCSYLNVHSRQVSYEELVNVRNKNGGKYYPCERCRPSQSGSVYITEDGGSYHSRKDCYSLRRTIRIVPLKEAIDNGYSLCSKCG